MRRRGYATQLPKITQSRGEPEKALVTERGTRVDERPAREEAIHVKVVAGNELATPHERMAGIDSIEDHIRRRVASQICCELELLRCLQVVRDLRSGWVRAVHDQSWLRKLLGEGCPSDRRGRS